MRSCKRFRILIEAWGGGVVQDRIALIEKSGTPPRAAVPQEHGCHKSMVEVGLRKEEHLDTFICCAVP